MRNQDAARLGTLLQSGSHVHCVPHDGVVHLLLRAKIADVRGAGVDARADLDVHGRRALHHLDGHAHAGHSVFLHAMGLRVAKEHHHRVADELVERAAVLEHLSGHLLTVAIEPPGQLLIAQLLGAIAKANDVGEEHRQRLLRGRQQGVFLALEDGLEDVRGDVARRLLGEVLQVQMRLPQREVRVDARKQLRGVERLPDIVYRSQFEALHDVVGLHVGRQEDDGNVLRLWVGLEYFTTFVAVHLRHLHIH